MMGHYSVKQTEEYAITEQESISTEMQQLKDRLSKLNNSFSSKTPSDKGDQFSESLYADNNKTSEPQIVPQGRNLTMISEALDQIKKILSNN